MTLRLALARASHVLRQEGARSLWFKILGETVYRRLLLLERDLQEPIPEVTVRLPVAIGLLKKTEIAAYVQLRTDADAAAIRSRLDGGQVCFAARHRGGLVSTSWAATNRVWIDYLARELPLAADEVYCYDSFTDEAFRGWGLDAARTAEKLRYFRRAGYRRAVCVVSPENRASLRSCAKVGYRFSGLIGYVRIGPWTWHFCRVGHRPAKPWRLSAGERDTG